MFRHVGCERFRGTVKIAALAPFEPEMIDAYIADFPGPDAGDVILEFAAGKLTWLDLLSMADTQIDDTIVSAVPARPAYTTA